MNGEGLRLTVHCGERARVGNTFLADALTEIYARLELEASVLVRGAEGFGLRQHLRTDRLLTLSEDLPLVSVAVDARPRIEAALREIDDLRFSGLITVEPVVLVGDGSAARPPDSSGAAKLTVQVGRGDRVGGRPAHTAVVELLHRERVAAATVLLGVDGTRRGERRRARFFGGNAKVPTLVVAVGAGERIAAARPVLDAMLERPLITLEPVELCRAAGAAQGPPRPPPPEPGAGAAEVWQKLTVHCGEQSRHAGRPLAPQLVRALREAGAAGATSLRGVYGYQGGQRPEGDVLWRVRRRVPVMTVTIDTPPRIAAWLAVVLALTDEAGLVTRETLPTGRVVTRVLGPELAEEAAALRPTDAPGRPGGRR